MHTWRTNSTGDNGTYEQMTCNIKSGASAALLVYSFLQWAAGLPLLQTQQTPAIATKPNIQDILDTKTVECLPT